MPLCLYFIEALYEAPVSLLRRVVFGSRSPVTQLIGSPVQLTGCSDTEVLVEREGVELDYQQEVLHG